MVKLPWELLTPFSDFLKGLPSRQNRDEDEDEDEDEVQAYQDSMQRLRVSRTGFGLGWVRTVADQA
jgi:transcription initiation protein SPT3